MAEQKKQAREICMDELDNVNGGAGLTDWAASLFGSRKKAYAVQGQAEMTGAAADLSERPAPAGDGAPATVKALCPVCGTRTDFTVYSGARGVCKVCGYVRDDL